MAGVTVKSIDYCQIRGTSVVVAAAAFRWGGGSGKARVWW